MIALYLLAAHMAGDFVLQNRWQAALKLTDRVIRAQHVAWYLIPFVPVVVFCSRSLLSLLFLPALAALHYLTDSHRFQSTLGDVIQWRMDLREDPVACKQEWLDEALMHIDGSVTALDVNDEAVRWPPPNPWVMTPMMIDQTLHVIQLAVLGALLLR